MKKNGWKEECEQYTQEKPKRSSTKAKNQQKNKKPKK